jgi:hypothetical protein
MRLWTLHPCQLDARGLVALWREGLLAKAALSGRTVGYRAHPQLSRFRARHDPVACINAYLAGVLTEARRRGYRFDARKVRGRRARGPMRVTAGQVAFEWGHLRAKLRRRAPSAWRALAAQDRPRLHPLFVQVPGPVEPWERGTRGRAAHRRSR